MSNVTACLLKHFGAKSPIEAYREDMAGDAKELIAAGMDADAAWKQVTQAKLAELRAEHARITGAVSDAYAKTAAGKMARAGKADEATTAPAATHQDPGEQSEPATAPVVSESLQKAAKSEDRKPSEMRAELLAKIDVAMASAKDADDQDVQRYDERGRAKPDRRVLMRRYGRSGRQLDSAIAEVQRKIDAERATAAENIGFVTFDVPGDGEFKVINTKARLIEFRRKVESSPGFKNTTKPIQSERVNGYGMKKEAGSPFGVESGSGGPKAVIQNMIDEGDAQAAVDYAASKGVEIADTLKGDKDRLEKIAGLTPTAEQQAQPEAEPAKKPAAKSDEPSETATSETEPADRPADVGAAPEGLKPGSRRAPRPFDPVSREFEHAGKTWRITVDRHWKIDSIEERYKPDLLTWTARVKKEYYGTSMFEPVASDAVPAAVAKKASEFFENVRALDAGEAAQPAKSLAEVRKSWADAGIESTVSEKDGTIELGRIVVPKDARGGGIGTRAMRELTGYADATGQRIVLTPETSFGATSVARLTAFYKRLGFKPNKGRSRDFTTRAGMIREPMGDAGNAALYSRTGDTPLDTKGEGKSTAQALRAALESEFGADTISALERAGLLTIADKPAANMPQDAAGVTESGRIGLFADNTAPGSTAVAYHEALHATLRRMIGDAAFEALMRRMPLLAAGNRKWFAEASGRIPADTSKAARNSELASYAVEQYQLAREAMPTGVRKWVQDLIAAIKVGLGKALQAAGVGLKLRVRLLSDAAVLHKLARDGLRTMAREAGQGAMSEAPAFSVVSTTDSAAFRKWFGDSKVVENGLEELLSKPDGVGVLLRDLLAAQNATGSGLNPVQALMLALAKNDKIGRSIVGLVPVDVVNSFSKDGLRPKDGGGNTSMFVNALNAPVSDQVLSTFRGILTSLSTKLANAIATGRDQEIAPALLASDFNLREVGGLLSLQGSTDFWGGNTGVKSVSAGEAAKSTSPGLGSPAKDFKLDATALADLFNKFVSFAPHAKTSTSDDLPSAKYIAKQGKPLVVYHGTRAKEPIAEFDLRRTGSQTDSGWMGRGFYFGDSGTAGAYAGHHEFDPGHFPQGGAVYPVFLSLKNPAVLTGTERESSPSFMVRELLDLPDVASAEDVRVGLLNAGYDGVIYERWSPYGNGYKEYVAFRPEQVKSAIGNNGAFDATNPDIRYSIAGTIGGIGGGTKMAGRTSRQHTPDQQRAMRNVGRIVEKPTLEQRVKELWKDAGMKLAQGLVDQFAPIKAISDKAYGLMRLSKGASGAFEAFLNGGMLKLTDGVYDFDETKRGGVVETLLQPLQGEHHDFLWWVAANRAERLASEGKENLFSDDDIDDLKSLADGATDFDYTIQNGAMAGQTTRDRSLIYEDSLKTFNSFNKNVLDMAEQSGLIDGASRAVWEHEFYVPFYRVADEDGGVRGMSVKGSAVRQEAFKTLKGGRNALNNDLLDNTLMNWAHLLDASAKNRAAVETLNAAESVGAAISSTESAIRDMSAAMQKKNGVVWVMEGGEKHFYLIEDPHLVTALTALDYAGMKGPVMDAMGTFKRVLTIGVTASPFFKVRNLIRDSIQAIGTGDIGYNAAANVAQGWKLTSPKSDAYFRLLAGGGTIHFGTMTEGNEGKRIQALVESGVDRSTILSDENSVKAFYRRFIEPGITAYNELGNRGEAINRASLYAQLRAKGVNHAEASLQARDLMDFSMQGSFTTVRFLTQVVPFFNARIQGLYKLGRSTKADPARMGIVLGATAAASLALLLAYSDDDDWKKREDWDRNNFWWFKFGGTAFRIPKPFEIGAIASLAERGFELAFSKEMTSKRFGQNVLELLGNNLSMNPVPQLVKPMLDVYANLDSFTGRPVESMGMERLRPEYRFTGRSSMLARGASTAANAVTNKLGFNSPSPVQIDHMLRGYFGWLGAFIIGASEIVARPATGQVSQPMPDLFRAATGNMVSDLRDAPSQYVSQMYNQARELEEAYGTWRALLKSGKTEEAAEFRADNRDELNRYRFVERVKSDVSKINQRIRAIEQSDLGAMEKRLRIREANVMKDRLARRLEVH